jgi:hypothetical protein
MGRRGSAWTAAALCAAALLCLPGRAGAQHLLEVRAADTKYRYVDWTYSWRSGPVVDVFYVGVEGSNELDVGAGYALKRGHLAVTPLVYAVAGKEGSQRGAKVALLVSYERDGWRVLSFIGQYVRASGAVGSYQVLDTADVTRTIGTRWEAGIQAGFFRGGGAWDPQVGPIVKFNDAHGAWAASYRAGPRPEFRVGRVLAF